MKFYNNEGGEINDETLSLVKNEDDIYLEPHGNKFDYNNILGHFDDIQELGKGGFGSVHKAKNKENDTLVAIKYIDISECSILFVFK